ncbi:MAG TPA: hypothetical protein VFU47_06635 [Armatimonadota bacterium]|nr:hypothetical protein [Armatimonadota bacterium]
MKFQKIDSKQMPQVIVLGVLTAGVLGYGAFSFLSGSSPNKAQAANIDPATGQLKAPAGGDPTPAASPQPAQAAQPDGAKPQMAQGGAPGLGVGGVNPDPFRPTVGSSPSGAPVAGPKPPAAGSPAPGPRLPSVDAGSPGPAVEPAGPSGVPVETAPEPQKPARPALTVTGVLDVDKGDDMALVQVGPEQRIVQVGDKLPNDYRVKRIALDGVLLVHSGDQSFLPDRYFVPTGGNNQPATR